LQSDSSAATKHEMETLGVSDSTTAEAALAPPARPSWEPVTVETREVGNGRVWLTISGDVSEATHRSITALLAEDDEQSPALTIDQLAAELGVNRRTIERALKDGILIPTTYKEKRVRFSREYADRLKARADEARARGLNYVMGAAAATGSITGAVRVRRPQMSPERRAAATLWKLRHTPPRRARAKPTDGAPNKRRNVRRIERAPLTPEETAAREKRHAEGQRSAICITITVNRLHEEPYSVEGALLTLQWLRRLAGAESGGDAERVAKGILLFRRAIMNGTVDARKLAELRDLIPSAQMMESESARVMVKALANVAAWCQRSRVLASNRIRGPAPRR
jgi:hypothetical protein